MIGTSTEPRSKDSSAMLAATVEPCGCRCRRSSGTGSSLMTMCAEDVAMREFASTVEQLTVTSRFAAGHGEQLMPAPMSHDDRVPSMHVGRTGSTHMTRPTFKQMFCRLLHRI